MSTIGDTLRRERVRQGLDLQVLSQTTKIGTRMLQAIEVGDYTKLPGGVFTRSFIKQYALALGLDPASLENELSGLRGESEESGRSGQTGALQQNEPKPSNSLISSAAWVLLAVAACIGVYYLLRPEEPKKTAPVIAQSAQKSAPNSGTEPQLPAAESPRVAGNPVSAASPAIGNGPLQVVLSALEPSWVSISVDGKLKFSGTLQANDRREINAEDRVKVVAGNAGGVEISLNGKNIDALGPKGQVRTVELTRAGAQVVSRTPKPEPLF